MLQRLHKITLKEAVGFSLFVLLIGFCLWGIYGGIYLTPKEYQEYGCYTLGTTTGRGYKHRHGRVIYYQYEYKGRIYNRWELRQPKVEAEGGKYLVKVNGKRPEVSMCLFSKGQVEEIDTTLYNLCP